MKGQGARTDRIEEAREVLLAARREAELVAANPGIVTKYAGQWVAIQDGRVVAHAADGAELAKVASINRFPEAIVQYVPSLDEQEGILILGLDRTEESAS